MWLYVLLITFYQSTITSYNQPKFCPTVSWNQTGVTFANKSLVGQGTSYVYLDQNDRVYIQSNNFNEIHVWFPNSTNSLTVIPGTVVHPGGLFVTKTSDIYLVSPVTASRVQKLDRITSTYTNIAYFCDNCYDLFVTANGILYCSMFQKHQVAAKLLDGDSNLITIVAGVGFPGTTPATLRFPRGIYVKDNLDLYIADCSNHRVQLFKAGQFFGITVAERIGTKTLYYPTTVMLDSNDHLYIVDSGNHRIVRSEPNDSFRCLVGCSGSRGSTSYELNYPINMAFDKQGNIYVTDANNNRIQKFFLSTNTCNSTYNTTKHTAEQTTSSSVRNLSTIQIRYSSALTTNSSIYRTGDCRLGRQYYELVQIYVSVSADYILIINGSLNTYVHLYEDNFYPFIPLGNLILQNFGRCHGAPVEFISHFYSHRRYLIAVRSEGQDKTGQFSILVTSPHSVNITAAQPTDTSFIVQTIFSSVLIEEGEVYARTICTLPDYRFAAIEIRVKKSDYYKITSNATFMALGYIYEEHFDPLNPTKNLWNDLHEEICDDQFALTVNFQANKRYVLVVTTHSPFHIGEFSIIVTGLYNVSLKRLTNIPRFLYTIHTSIITSESPMYNHGRCEVSRFYYDAVEMHFHTTGFYMIVIKSPTEPDGSLYEQNFHPFNPSKNLLLPDVNGCSRTQFYLTDMFLVNQTYVLVVTSNKGTEQKITNIVAIGPATVTYNPIKMIESTYTSELTEDSQTYSRICEMGKFHYETIEINVNESGIYGFQINSTVKIYGYMYKHEFDPFNPSKNLLVEANYTCNMYEFQFTLHLVVDTSYELVVTTFDSDVRGPFSVRVLGPNNISINHTIRSQKRCTIGDQCHSYTKGIGLALDDILRGEIRPYVSFNDQSVIIKISMAITVIMFVGGIVNSILSVVTFQNKEIRKIGCGIYLLSSSVTSLFTVTMFTIKFLFVLFTKINQITNVSAFRVGCISIDFFLKIFVYVDGWLNACVAAERTIAVFKGISFNPKKSRRAARWIIVLLPLFVIITFIHEPIHRNIFEYKTEKYHFNEDVDWANASIGHHSDHDDKTKRMNRTVTYTVEQHLLCTISYSHAVQNYNTIVLFFHLITPFIINLLSALYIIFGTARQKSTTRTAQSYTKHALNQFNEHKQLLISSLMLLVLSLPRLIISLIPECVDVSHNRWLYLSGYFISFTPSMLVFVVFVLPSELYKRKLRETLARYLNR